MDLWPAINQNPRKTKGFLQLRDGWSTGEHCRDGSLGQTGKVNIRLWAECWGSKSRNPDNRLKTVNGNLNTWQGNSLQASSQPASGGYCHRLDHCLVRYSLRNSYAALTNVGVASYVILLLINVEILHRLSKGSAAVSVLFLMWVHNLQRGPIHCYWMLFLMLVSMA